MKFYIDGFLRCRQLYASQSFIEWDLVDFRNVLTPVSEQRVFFFHSTEAVPHSPVVQTDLGTSERVHAAVDAMWVNALVEKTGTPRQLI